ncbi:Polynucleotide 5'-hydroxyl-kinase grc3, partial [Ascosphaera pollenicola]
GSIVGVVAVDDTNPLFSGAGTVSPETRGEDFETEAISQDPNDTTTKQEPSTSIRLNKDNIPYILAGDHSNGGLDPSTSRSLGLAIIHSINTETNSFTLYTPIPLTTIRTVIEQGHHIAFVNGQIDSPHWAISEGYFAARTAQLKHRQAMALAKEMDSGSGGEVTHHELSIKSMMLRDQVRLAGRVPWMNVSMNDAAGDAKEAEGRMKMFRLRKKTNGAGESDAEW